MIVMVDEHSETTDSKASATCAEVLRAAAKLMRERADACPSRAHVGSITWTAQTDQRIVAPGQHYTAWSPAVAIAVADWLNDAALVDPDDEWIAPEALAVARAYLGDAS